MNIKKNPLHFILLFYFTCFLFRAVEYFFIRTDQSVIGEAFIHKIVGIALLAAAGRRLHYKWSDIGFCANRAVKSICFGFLFGGVIFFIAYGAEMLIQVSAGNRPTLQFYVTSYTAQGNRSMQGGALFVFICLVGNIINVVMEEGVFRGLFVRLGERKYSFVKTCLLSSFLFGLWHIAQPVRNVLDSLQSPMGALMLGLMLVGTSMLGGIQYVLLYKLTGALWFGMAVHFINNSVVNLLHVVTAAGVDELQTIRLTIAQSLSFIAVFIVFLLLAKKARSETFK